MTLRSRRIILAFSILAFLIMVPLVLLYTSGYRMGSDFHLIKTGGFYVSSPVSGSQIFVDGQLEKETNILQSGFFMQNLKPGTYSVLVAKEGYWPWIKKLNIKEQMVTEARALILPREPKTAAVSEKDFLPAEAEKYAAIKSEFKKLNSLPKSEIAEKFTNHGRERMWWKPEENKVWVEWIGEEESRPYYLNEDKNLVLDSAFPVRNADFYPGRKDVIIVAVQNGVFAIETDARGGRILQPVYRGIKPVFTLHENDPAIYILDAGTLIKVSL